jgi:hypothetical protein
MKGIAGFISQDDVKPDMTMRVHPWLNIKTLTKKFSVVVKAKGDKHQSHVFDPATNKVRFFRKSERAQAFIEKLKK